MEIEIRARNGSIRAVALVDDVDVALTRVRWQLDAGGYVQRVVVLPDGHRTSLKLHRVVMGLESGDGLEVDHRDGNKLDNRRSNLRVATRSQNSQNRHARRTVGSSSFRGVTWNCARQKWQAQVGLDGRCIYLGLHASETAAAQAAAAYRATNMPFSAEAA